MTIVWVGELTSIGTAALAIFTAFLAAATLRLGEQAKRSADATYELAAQAERSARIASADSLRGQRAVQIDRLNSARVVIIANTGFPARDSVSPGWRVVLVGLSTSSQPVLLSGSSFNLRSHLVLPTTGQVAQARGYEWVTSTCFAQGEEEVDRFRTFLNEECHRFSLQVAAHHLGFLGLYESITDLATQKDTPPQLEMPDHSWIALCLWLPIAAGLELSVGAQFYAFEVRLHDGATAPHRVHWTESGPVITRMLWNSALALPEHDEVLGNQGAKTA